MLRQLDSYEIVGRVQVIFAGLVDHPEQLAFIGRLVAEYRVELPQFQ